MSYLSTDTRPPVDLYCYYLFLQREGSEDSLDFWLDVQQHENLCKRELSSASFPSPRDSLVDVVPTSGRAYFKDLRKSGRQVKQDWPQYHQLARTRGSIYGNVTGIRRGDSSETSGDSQQSSPRRGGGGGGTVEERELYEHEQDLAQQQLQQEQDHARLSVDDQQRYTGQPARTPSPRPSGASSSNYPLSPTLKALYPHDQSEEELRDTATPGGDSSLRRRKDHKRHSTAGGGGGNAAQPFIPRDTAINRTDLIASAERIYSRYLMPGSDKEIYLPHTLRITSFPISSSVLPSVTHPTYDAESNAQARVPDMFHQQKEFVYRQMESDSFPRFLRAKAFGNLTGISGLVRLGVGLVSLWAGLATAFALIFLDKKPKVTRLWVR